MKVVEEEHVNIAKESDLQLRHCRFCHLGMDNVTKLMNNKMVDGMDKIAEEKSHCEACIMGNNTVAHIPKE